MKNRRISRAYIIAACFFVTVACVPLQAISNAQAQAGLTVAPAQLSFRIKPDVPSQTAVVTLTNSYSAKLQLNAELQAIDETGVRLVPTGPADAMLRGAISLSATDITVPANGTYELRITARDSAELADGGHYGSLVLTQHAGGAATSTFRSSVAVSIFVIKDQNIRTDFRLTTINLEHSFFAPLESVTVTLANHGNVHIIPRASTGVYDGERLIGRAIVNTNSQLLLPGEQASFRAPIQTFERIFVPRKLQVRTMYRIDGSDVQLMHEQAVWYVPVVDVVALVAGVAILWWQRRRIVRVSTNGIVMVRLKLSKKRRRKSGKPATAPHATTKRILGRTVIRTHQATSRSLGQPTAARLQPRNSDARHTIVQKRIAVSVADEPISVSADGNKKTLSQRKTASSKQKTSPVPKKARSTASKVTAPKRTKTTANSTTKTTKKLPKKPTVKSAQKKQ